MLGAILAVIAIAVSWFGITKKEFLIGVIAGVAWLIFYIYYYNNYQGVVAGFGKGSSGDTITTVALLGLVIGLPLMCWTFSRHEKKYNERDEQEYQFKVADRKAHKAPPTYSDITSTSNSVNLQDMSDADYMKLLQRQTRRNKK